MPGSPVVTSIEGVEPMVAQGMLTLRVNTDVGVRAKMDIAVGVVPDLILQLSAALTAMRPGTLDGDTLSATIVQPKGTRLAVSKDGAAIAFDMGGYVLALQPPEATLRGLYKQLGQYLNRQ